MTSHHFAAFSQRARALVYGDLDMAQSDDPNGWLQNVYIIPFLDHLTQIPDDPSSFFFFSLCSPVNFSAFAAEVAAWRAY